MCQKKSANYGTQTKETSLVNKGVMTSETGGFHVFEVHMPTVGTGIVTILLLALVAFLIRFIWMRAKRAQRRHRARVEAARSMPYPPVNHQSLDDDFIRLMMNHNPRFQRSPPIEHQRSAPIEHQHSTSTPIDQDQDRPGEHLQHQAQGARRSACVTLGVDEI